jgi:hypothetical protein
MRLYLPNCRTYGSLAAPTDAATTYETVRQHRKIKPDHSTGVVPIRTDERNNE